MTLGREMSTRLHSSGVLHTLPFKMIIVAAGKRTVSCDFEDVFICGYTKSTAGTITWERIDSKALSISGSSEGRHGPASLPSVIIIIIIIICLLKVSTEKWKNSQCQQLEQDSKHNKKHSQLP